MVEASIIRAGDIILVPGNFPRFFPVYLIMMPFTRGYNHSAIVYGKNERREFLVVESIFRCGPVILFLSKYLGKEVEVYRMDHPLADTFCQAILAAGDEILKKNYTFFDFLLLFPRAVMAYFGFSGRIGHKYYPFYLCSEFMQICFEEAPRFIGEASIALGKNENEHEAIINFYRDDILAKFPKAKFPKNKIRLMAPYDFKNLSFFELVGKGKLADE